MDSDAPRHVVQLTDMLSEAYPVIMSANKTITSLRYTRYLPSSRAGSAKQAITHPFFNNFFIS